MIDERTRAAVTLHAVLRNLEDLVELDEEAAGVIAGRRARVRFLVPGVRPLSLTFADGACRVGGSARDVDPITLAFVSPTHLTSMIDGSGTPIPVRGLRHLEFLKGPFTRLTDRLEAVLRPAPGAPDDPEAARVRTILTAYTAFFALGEIGTYDPVGKLNAARIADGAIEVSITGGPSLHLTASGGALTVGKGPAQHPRATMRFASLDVAGGVLAGTLDTYAVIGDGRLSISGYVPMIDNMNKLLAQVSAYLA